MLWILQGHSIPDNPMVRVSCSGHSQYVTYLCNFCVMEHLNTPANNAENIFSQLYHPGVLTSRLDRLNFYAILRTYIRQAITKSRYSGEAFGNASECFQLKDTYGTSFWWRLSSSVRAIINLKQRIARTKFCDRKTSKSLEMIGLMMTYTINEFSTRR